MASGLPLRFVLKRIPGTLARCDWKGFVGPNGMLA
jgi:hypothetical protein